MRILTKKEVVNEIRAHSRELITKRNDRKPRRRGFWGWLWSGICAVGRFVYNVGAWVAKIVGTVLVSEGAVALRKMTKKALQSLVRVTMRLQMQYLPR